MCAENIVFVSLRVVAYETYKIVALSRNWDISMAPPIVCGKQSNKYKPSKSVFNVFYCPTFRYVSVLAIKK